jgi:hypothetical protein
LTPEYLYPRQPSSAAIGAAPIHLSKSREQITYPGTGGNSHTLPAPG